jgi:hypothetical protein
MSNKYANRDFTPMWLYHLPFHTYLSFCAADYITDDFGRSVESNSAVYGIEDDDAVNSFVEEAYGHILYPEYRVVDKPEVMSCTEHTQYPEYRVIR